MKKAFLLNVFLQLFVDANREELWQNKLCNIPVCLVAKEYFPYLFSLTYTAWQKNYLGQEIVGKTCSHKACFSFGLFYLSTAQCFEINK